MNAVTNRSRSDTERKRVAPAVVEVQAQFENHVRLVGVAVQDDAQARTKFVGALPDDEFFAILERLTLN